MLEKFSEGNRSVNRYAVILLAFSYKPCKIEYMMYSNALTGGPLNAFGHLAISFNGKQNVSLVCRPDKTFS